MANRLPVFSDEHKICVICEGNEEYAYLKRLKSLNVWNKQYEILPDNAGGNGNIPARYQDRYQNGAYELVLVFCDTERKPYEQYVDIKRKINEFHAVYNAAGEVIMFGNPCTMQIITKHWTDENIKSPAKPVNIPLIKEYTGVEKVTAYNLCNNFIFVLSSLRTKVAYTLRIKMNIWKQKTEDLIVRGC